MSTTEYKFPTETIKLPSQGKLYPKDSALASGEVEVKYMSAKEEDILSNTNYIKAGTVVDKLLESMIVSPIKYQDLLLGDKNAILVSARILAYGSDYEVSYDGETHKIDLSQISTKELHPDVAQAEENLFEFVLPTTGRTIQFKLMTHSVDQAVEQEIKGLKKINKESSAEVTTRYKHMIVSVDGKNDVKSIRDFVDHEFLTRDTREFKKYLKDLQPDLDMRFYPENGPDGGVQIPMGVNFLWPDAEL